MKTPVAEIAEIAEAVDVVDVVDRAELAVTTTASTPVNLMPSWMAELTRMYTKGVTHSFILHFNVTDYAEPGHTLKQYMSRMLASFDIIAYYNRSEGITFALPTMRERAMVMMGLDAGGGDDLLAALSGRGGAGPGLGSGSTPGADEGPLLPRPSDALPALERLLKANTAYAQGVSGASGASGASGGDDVDVDAPDIEAGPRVLLFMDYAETLVPKGEVATMSAEDRTCLITIDRWGHDKVIDERGHMVALVTANVFDVNPMLRVGSSKYKLLEIPLPDLAARRSFIESYRQLKQLDPDAFQWQVQPAYLANATAGLGLIHIEDIFLLAEADGVLTYELVKERKADIMAGEFAEVLESFDPRFGWEAIGGMERIKDFFDRSVIRPMREGRTRRCPQGVLMLGPAGTGKSAVAEAVAKESGINFVILNPARIFQGLVGSSERNLEKAISGIKQMAPVICFCDEIDQAFQRGSSGDSGVSNRLFKRIMEFMADPGNRGRILFLAASNRPDMLDAAFRRPGRFDKKIPFLTPEPADRQAIFKVMSLKYGLEGAAIPKAVIDKTEGWTGAEIELASVKAWELVEDGRATLDNAFAEAIRLVRPSTADIQLMTILAIREVSDLDLLPDRYWSLKEKPSELDSQIKTLQEAAPSSSSSSTQAQPFSCTKRDL